MEFPSVTKYDPKPTYLKHNFAKDGLGILRSRRDFSYINDQKTPGPANYDTLKDARLPNTLILGKIDRAPRLSPGGSGGAKHSIPGPGDYDLLKPFSQRRDWDAKRKQAELFREIRRVLSVPRSHNRGSNE